jgi:predicted dehydrogenase
VPTRIGLIGAGNISATHARAIAAIPDTTVVGVFGPTPARAQALAGASGARAYDAVESLLDAERPDVVVIGTPSGLHGAHGAAAADRGVHVLVEKPIEISVARADALIARACSAGVTLGVIFQDRVKPDVRALKALVESGELGPVSLVHAQVPWWRPPEYYAASRWRGTWALDGGGALMNQGIHTVDLMAWLFGPVARVSGAIATRFHAIEVEDTAAAVLEFASGAIGTIQATTCAFPGRPRRIEIAGPKGTAILEGDSLIQGRAGIVAAPENAASPVVSDVSAHCDVIADFIRAFRTGTPPCCDGATGRRSVQLVEAVYHSSRTGRAVDLLQG